ncbi:MAG: threonine-phosphate decarboxylase CobD [Coleofasciculus sp. G1-WW12-02]|uniref:threonine-phosphate decarboxylase CobD n=1 Tax=Coleofasciculus sp. G1-WW12-02 TaxID=3068483 RepID=UPI0032FC17D9
MKRPIHGGNLAWAAARAGCSPSLILDFSASINPLGPPKCAIAAIESHLDKLVAYPEPDYYPLRVALSQLHPTLNPDWILPGNGSAELLTWAARELSELEETIILTPAFSDYQRALRAFNARIRACLLFGSHPFVGFVGAKHSRPDLSVFYQHPNANASPNPPYPITNPPSPITNPPYPIPNPQSPIPKLVSGKHQGLLLNNPHNPTGQLWDTASLLPYLEQFALVVVDEAFMDFLPPAQQQSLIPWVQDYPNLVILRSLTKFYSLPGLRLGYAIAHPERLQRWQQWRDPWSVNVLAVAAGRAVVQDQAFQQQTWDWLPAARSHLFQGLSSLPGLHPYPSAANFLLVRSEYSCSQLQEHLLKHHRILIRDCLSFPELGDGYFRVAIRTQVDNQRLLDALKTFISYEL